MVPCAPSKRIDSSFAAALFNIVIVFFGTGLGKGLFRRLVRATDQGEISDDLKQFNETVAIICALIISFTYSFNIGDISPDERNFFALCGEDQFQDNRLSIGQIAMGVCNYLILILCAACIPARAAALHDLARC